MTAPARSTSTFMLPGGLALTGGRDRPRRVGRSSADPVRPVGDRQPARRPTRPRRFPAGRASRAALGLAAVATVLVVGTSADAATHKEHGGTVTFAEPPGSPL